MAYPIAYFKLSNEQKILYKAGWCDEHGNPTESGSEVNELINFEQNQAKMVELALEMNKELKNESSKKN